MNRFTYPGKKPLDRDYFVCRESIQYWVLHKKLISLLVSTGTDAEIIHAPSQPDDVPQFLSELWVVGDVEALDLMRLQVVFPPDSVHRHPRYPHLGRQRSATPMGSDRRLAGEGQDQDFLHLRKTLAA